MRNGSGSRHPCTSGWPGSAWSRSPSPLASGSAEARRPAVMSRTAGIGGDMLLEHPGSVQLGGAPRRGAGAHTGGQTHGSEIGEPDARRQDVREVRSRRRRRDDVRRGSDQQERLPAVPAGDGRGLAVVGVLLERRRRGPDGLHLGRRPRGFAVALLTIFNKPLARVTAPIYALLEGLALGALSALMELRYPGIVMQAVALTFGTLAAMLVLYRIGVIRASERFKAIVCAATGAIGLFYIVALGLRFIGIPVPLIHEASTIGILFSLFVVTVAALNLIIDFDFIEGGVEAGAPKVAEWYAATVT